MAYGMDEVWMDVTGSTKAFGSGEMIANTLRERIKYELGLTISVGVSFCKVFAKLGSDLKKPDAVTVIPKDSFRDIIWDLPASDMLGVGRSTEKFLSSYGIHTIGQLANAYPDLMRRKLGKNGMVLLAFANGEDRSKVAPQDYEPPMKSIGHSITIMQDLENNAEVWNIMLALTQDIGHKLRVYNKNAAGVAIYIRYIRLAMKKEKKRVAAELQLHSDQGFQYTSQAYFKLTQSYGITPSMSSKGNPYDNAMAENFFSILKTECIYRHKPKTFREANDLIDRYIHFYNYERIQNKTGVAPLTLRHSA